MWIKHERIPMGYPVFFHPVEIVDGKPCYCVYHPDLPGCMSDGETPEEAVESLADARRMWIEVGLEYGNTIPEPPYADVCFHSLGVVCTPVCSERAGAGGDGGNPCLEAGETPPMADTR